VTNSAISVEGVWKSFRIYSERNQTLKSVVMRRKRPARDGLFMIGGGKIGLYLVTVLPMLTWCATFGLALTEGGIKVFTVTLL